jgi:hypothetical protein
MGAAMILLGMGRARKVDHKLRYKTLRLIFTDRP